MTTKAKETAKHTARELAEGLNTAVDLNLTGEELRRHLFAIQPDRRTQALWDAAPVLLEAAKELQLYGFTQCKHPAGFKPCLWCKFRTAIAKAEGVRP